VDVGLNDNLQAGLELAKEATQRRPRLKVLYTTDQVVTDGMKALMVPGAAMLEKPYTVEQLQASLAVHFVFPCILESSLLQTESLHAAGWRKSGVRRIAFTGGRFFGVCVVLTLCGPRLRARQSATEMGQ
jgi:hypothetical protein